MGKLLDNVILYSKCLKQIDEISKLKYDWDGDGATAPDKIIIENVKNFITLIFDNGYKIYDEENIFPTPLGSIVIEIEPKDDYFVSVEIGTGAIGWYTKLGNNYPEELMSSITKTDFESLPKDLKIALDKLYSII